jgi:hypothetical protein
MDERRGKDAAVSERGFSFELVADDGAPDGARDAIATDEREALRGVDRGARLTASLLARSVVASCVRGGGGRVRVRVAIGDERVRVEVSGEGPGFVLPLSQRSIDHLSFDDAMPQPIGWRAYLLDRLADAWGIDDAAGAAWFEVDHASTDARRLRTRQRIAVASPAGSAR